MSIVDLLGTVQSGGHIDWDDAAQIPPAVADLLQGLVGDVQALMEVAKRPATAVADGMTRSDALKIARDHVEAMATNTRGYQDGVKMHDKVQATERFARFLMGESE
ncbi:hypothetical protein AB0F77_39535 [Streptomyces sp. NPDC026672]|uniref:hypothetical protein n=1 Tax=Actinomycetes TaxID=1760 RepID=UPI0033DA9C79